MSVPDDALNALLRDLTDGRGRVLVVPPDDDLRPMAQAGRDAGLLVVDLLPDPQLRAFALGPLIRGLRRVGHPPGVPLMGAAGLPVRTSRRLVRAIRRQVHELDGVLLVAHDEESLDAVTRQWLDTAAHAEDDSPAWIVRTSAGRSELPSGHIEQLDSRELLIARLLAASDFALTADELAELSDETPRTCLSAADALSECRIAAVHDGRYVLRNAYHREVLNAELPPSIRSALERGALRLARRRTGTTTLSAERAMSSARPRDSVAISILTEAMDELVDVEPEAAADYGNAAVALFTDPDEQLTDLAWRLLPLLWQTSRVDEARLLAKRVFAESGRAEVEAQVLLWLARLEGTPQRALELATTALAIPGVPLTIRARLHGVRMRCLSTLGRVHDVDAQLPAALAEARASGDDEALSRLQTCDAIRHFYRGEYTRSASLTALADATWRRSGAPTAEWMPEMIWSPHLTTVLGDPDEGLRRVHGLLDDLATADQPLATQFLHGERALAHLALGHLDDAQDAAVLAATQSQREWGVHDRLQAIAFSVRLKVALHQGALAEFDELRAVLDRSHVEAGSEAEGRRAWWYFLLDDAQGSIAPDRRSIDPDTLSPLPWLDPADEVLIGRALRINGYERAGQDLVDRAAARLDGSGNHVLAVTVADHLHGVVRVDASSLERARHGWHLLGRPLLEAAALSDHGAVLLGAGDTAGAALMEEAHGRLTALGAQRDAWRIRWHLGLHGHVIVPERTGAPTLTPTERRIVDSAARGGSVRRIASELGLSPHTVTTHLRHVYTKLDIRSRKELNEWVRAR
ncbi:helix-turn-helix transcriptional regulator [Cryptosporangium arvum]|uniref:Response regulator containing a CheY-like receiver domain and an HTH DNA-binding domain n=1 Tax=Cryptosporangium arvum DSM 44712 TaxID=927661 RepID=A0A011AJ57_9ACTN|nr:helix-turn-helix transcriptional regulator [Cryptosporangium arvum]EXG82061.1 response regulator containing a CheY-like receiver domain and an HTH DNA-binding domain [Cryptosporangium arvum DSM 44712]